MIFENVAKLLKESREKADLKQVEVADRFKLESSQFVSNIERALCHPPLFYCKIFAKIYGIRPSRIEAAYVADCREWFRAQNK